MRSLIRSLTAGAVMALGLAVPNYALAQAKEIPNTLYSTNPFETTIGDGVTLKNLEHPVGLIPGRKVNVEDYVTGLYARFQGEPIHWKVISIDHGLEGIVSYLKRTDGKNPTGREKASVKYYEGLKGRFKSDPASMKRLTEAMSDGILDPVKDSLYNEKTGSWNIKDGYYMFVAEGEKAETKTVKFGAQSIPIIAHIETGKAKEAKILTYEGIPVYVPSFSFSKKPTEIGGAPGKGKRAEGSRGFLGLEAGAEGNAREHNFTLGINGDVPLSEKFYAGVFADAYINGNEIRTSGTQVTSRQEILTPNKDTYKIRVDEITTNTGRKPIAAAGIEVMLKEGRFGFPVRAGAQAVRKTEDLVGTATIGFLRDGQPLGPDNEISNTKTLKPKTELRPYLSAGAEFYVTNNVSIGASYDRIGSRNAGTIAAKIKLPFGKSRKQRKWKK